VPYGSREARHGDAGFSALGCQQKQQDASDGPLDFIFDAASDGRPLKALSMCDEFTRESLASRVGRSTSSSDPLPSAAVATLMDGPITHQQRSGTSTT
jgi:hypothetical protein